MFNHLHLKIPLTLTNHFSIGEGKKVREGKKGWLLGRELIDQLKKDSVETRI